MPDIHAPPLTMGFICQVCGCAKRQHSEFEDDVLPSLWKCRTCERRHEKNPTYSMCGERGTFKGLFYKPDPSTDWFLATGHGTWKLNPARWIVRGIGGGFVPRTSSMLILGMPALLWREMLRLEKGLGTFHDKARVSDFLETGHLPSRFSS